MAKKATIEIFDAIEQNSPEWLELRRGLPTASVFSDILAKDRTGKTVGKMRTTLMYKLAGELLTGEVIEGYSNDAMKRGHAMEDEVRQQYAFVNDAEPLRVGFVRNGIMGCSPDSLIGTNKVLEIKTHEPHILIPMILSGEFPSMHKAQCQGHLLVTERGEVDLICYWPKMPAFQITVGRDEEYLRMLADEVAKFHFELHELVKRLKG